MKPVHVMSVDTRLTSTSTDFWTDFLFAFERELANFRIPVIPNYGHTKLDPKSLERKNSLGFLIQGYGEGWAEFSGTSMAELEQDMAWASGTKLPVVIYNASVIIGKFPAFSFEPYRNLFPVAIDNWEAGRRAGTFLAEQGHRRVCYFSFSSEFWNTQRFEGLALTSKSTRKKLERVVPFDASFDKTAFLNPNGIEWDTLRGQLVSMARKVDSTYKGDKWDSWPMVLRPFKAMIIHEQMLKTMEPLFEAALQDRSFTAWVASEPPVAVAALKFLRNRKVRVPREISLFSIDDNPGLARFGITGSVVKAGPIAHLAAHCLIGDIEVKKDLRGIVICEPKIIDRGSVAKA